jgi:putative tryptophan/tyrosine transport system substrate-binding protein
MIGRRILLMALPLVGLPAAAIAQLSRRVHRVGVLTPSPQQWEADSFMDELRKLGHDPGKAPLLDIRSAEGDLGRLPALAVQLVKAGVDVIVAANTPAARAAMAATSILPIIAGAVADPVLLGLVSNLARPGGNVTGVSNMSAELAPKRLEILKEAVPSIRRIVTQYHPDEPISAPQIRDLDQAANRFGIAFQHHPVRTGEDVETSLRQAVGWPADALMRLAGQGLTLGGPMAELALRQRLPAMVLTAVDVRAGGLISYFANHSALWRRAAHLTHRVLAGDAAGELPFERPTQFELAINLATAKALGLTLPPSILARADEVIE